MLSAFQELLAPFPLLMLCVGTLSGIVVGAIPGLTGAMLITLAMPLTFGMDSGPAMVLLVSMYVGSISGGLITATLLRMPGTPASIMTTLDGHPLAAAGQPGRALGLGIMASFVGGCISWLFLWGLARPMALWSLKLGPFEFFSLVLMALVLIASVSGGSLLKGLLSGLLGMAATLPGVSPATGMVRYTYGFSELTDGFKLLPVLIGLFAVSQVLRETWNRNRQADTVSVVAGPVWVRLRDWLSHAGNLVRSSVIGTWVGILPGIGANIGSILAYTSARKFSSHPEKFGSGAEDGIVASEAANNATVSGALVPLVAMGIPGSVIDAVLLGALVLHGLQPGPLLFRDNADIAYGMIATVLVANLVMFFAMLLSARWLARLVDIPRQYLMPTVLVFCVVGSYALGGRMFDVWVMLAFGLIGFALEAVSVPLAPFVIGFVLAPVAERNLSKALLSSNGSLWPLLTRPVSAAFFLVSVFLFLWPLYVRGRAYFSSIYLKQKSG